MSLFWGGRGDWWWCQGVMHKRGFYKAKSVLWILWFSVSANSDQSALFPEEKPHLSTHFKERKKSKGY